VSSDWPVCAINEIAAPHWLGAALTYARRNALFTPVGTAGEDDLDAPEVPAAGLSPGAQNSRRPEQDAGASNPPASAPASSRPLPSSERRAGAERVSPPPPLRPGGSKKPCRQLVSQLEQLEDPEALASWAHRALAFENQFAARDAKTVEDAFAAWLAGIGDTRLRWPALAGANARCFALTLCEKMRRMIYLPKGRLEDVVPAFVQNSQSAC
jgi:hypothetical protein